MVSIIAPIPRGISVVVPVYNSRQTLEPLISRLHPVLIATGLPYEAILVNDGSADESWSVIEHLVGEHGWVVGIDLMRNHGQENALLCGIRAANYDTTVTIDDDLQHPPEEIPRLLARLDEGFDVVYGSSERERHDLWRVAASSITKFVLQQAMGAGNARQATAFKAFRTQLREAFSGYRSPHVSIDVLLTWGTQRFGSAQVRHDPRLVGKSNFTFRRLVNHALNMLTGFSVVPLQLASFIGLLFSVLGCAALFYVLIAYFFGQQRVPGFTFLAAIIAIFSGAQMFALGIIGEYLARIHLRTMERQPYTIRRATSRQELSAPEQR